MPVPGASLATGSLGDSTRRSLLTIGAAHLLAAFALGSLAATVAAVDAAALSASGGVQLGATFFLFGVAAAWQLTSPQAALHRASVRTVFLLYSAIGFGLLSLAWTSQQTGTAGRIRQEFVPLAMLVTLVGILAWALGYSTVRFLPAERFAGWARNVAAPGASWRLRSPGVPVFLYAVGVAARMMQIRSGTYAYLADPRSLISSPSSVGQLLAMTERLTLVAITVAAVNVLRHRRAVLPRILLLLLLLLELATAGYGGTKSAIVFVLLAVAVPLLGTAKRLPVAPLALGILMLLLATSFVDEYRTRLVTTTGRLAGAPAREALIEAAGETLPPTRLFDSAERGVETLTRRLRQIDNVAIIVQRTPAEIGYRSPLELLTEPILAFIPRAAWHDKPVLTTGLDFSQQYYDLPPDLYTASAVTVVGDLFRHGGILVVIAGMALLGAVSRYADRFWHPSRDLRLSVLFAGAFVELINVEADAASFVTSLIVTVAVSIIATRVAFVPAPSDQG